jgi:mono/diheme cytochrome c family protein
LSAIGIATGRYRSWLLSSSDAEVYGAAGVRGNRRSGKEGLIRVHAVAGAAASPAALPAGAGRGGVPRQAMRAGNLDADQGAWRSDGGRLLRSSARNQATTINRRIAVRLSHLALGCALAVTTSIGAAFAQAPQPPARGAEFYRTACAQCHGADGKGGGPVARLLTAAPSDLTTLARRNNGAFPFVRVGQIIDGREDIMAHGGREMPFWGHMFGYEAGDRFGTRMREVYIQGRVYELVLYLNSIQQ